MGLSSLFNGDRPVYVITEQVFVHQFQEFVQDRGKVSGFDSLLIDDEAMGALFCYVIRPIMTSVQSVMMHMTRQPNHHRQYRVYWCPMPTVLCSTLLQV